MGIPEVESVGLILLSDKKTKLKRKGSGPSCAISFSYWLASNSGDTCSSFKPYSAVIKWWACTVMLCRQFVKCNLTSYLELQVCKNYISGPYRAPIKRLFTLWAFGFEKAFHLFLQIQYLPCRQGLLFCFTSSSSYEKHACSQDLRKPCQNWNYWLLWQKTETGIHIR